MYSTKHKVSAAVRQLWAVVCLLFLMIGLFIILTPMVAAAEIEEDEVLTANKFFCYTRYSKLIDHDDPKRKEACQKGYDGHGCGSYEGDIKKACEAGSAAQKPIPAEPKNPKESDLKMPEPPDFNTNAVGGVMRCGSVSTAYIMCPPTSGSGAEGSAMWGMLTAVINIALAVIGVAAVGGVVYAGIIYASSRDDETRVRQAKTLLFNIVIGLVIFSALYLLLQFIVPGGIF